MEALPSLRPLTEFTTMRKPHPDDLNEAIFDVCETLDAINRDIDRAPTRKQTTKWFRDRVTEQARLQAKLAQLRADQDALIAPLSDDEIAQLGEAGFRTITEWVESGS